MIHKIDGKSNSVDLDLRKSHPGEEAGASAGISGEDVSPPIPNSDSSNPRVEYPTKIVNVTGIRGKGSRYCGEMQRGEPNGDGTLTEQYGTQIYQGQLCHGMRHGSGSHSVPGRTYIGEWIWNARHGDGKLEFYTPNPRRVIRWIEEGPLEFSKEQARNYGYVGEDGNKVPARRYTGQFKRNMLHGQGLIEYTDGARLRGVFKNDQPPAITSENFLKAGLAEPSSSCSLVDDCWSRNRAGSASRWTRDRAGSANCWTRDRAGTAENGRARQSACTLSSCVLL